MKVLVDTPVWSLALRRKFGDLSLSERRVAESLTELIGAGRAELLGAVRQELLSGLREEEQFLRLCRYLRSSPDVTLSLEDYEDAAQASNRCRSGGIAASPVDLLICSVALRRNWQIFTTDGDFDHYAKVLPIRLFLSR